MPYADDLLKMMPAQYVRLFDDGINQRGILETGEAGRLALDAVPGDVRSFVLQPLAKIGENPAEEMT